MSSHDHARALFEAAFHDFALENGELLNVNLDAEISSSNHDHVGDLDDAIEVLHRFLILELGNNLSMTTEFVDGTGRWRALPVVRLDAAQKLVTATDPEISLFYGLLDAGGSPPSSGTGTSTSGNPTSDTNPATTMVDPDTGETTTVDPDTGETTMVDPDTGPGETTMVDPDTGPGESTDTGEETTTGNPIGCGNLPMPPLAVDEFMFDGTPLDGNSEDMTFSTLGSIITRDGADLVQISPAGVVTQIPTMAALPEPTLGTRWSPTGNIITAGQNTNEIH